MLFLALPIPRLYPASAKSVLRAHIKDVCKLSHCIDSLAIFVKGPTMSSGGKMLLWDKDGNGNVCLTHRYIILYSNVFVCIVLFSLVCGA